MKRVTDNFKICKNCKLSKPLSEFYKSRYWSKHRGEAVIKFAYHPNCKVCERKKNNERRFLPKTRTIRNQGIKGELMPLEQKRLAVRDTFLRRRYGISLAEYHELLEKQNNKCAICGEPPKGTSTIHILAVDHCHLTGKVRGLLCHKCNGAIGLMRDNCLLLLNAIDYLRKDANQNL